MKFLLSFLVMLVIAVAEESIKEVKTTSGSIKGREVTLLDKQLKMFLGIPYSLPPIGDLRFKPPVPLQSENNMLDAHSFKPICYQPPHAVSVINPLLTPNKTSMSEDCLYLNLYVPVVDEPVPVMVWLPGEGFNYADPTQFDGSILAVSSKVIVVTVSYRVSVFGFFNALSKDAPGNVGLLDQRLALKWVKENIANFGGDPERVTLFGRFTGSMSVAIHAFSPLSKEEKLFSRIILHSGVPHGKWIFNQNPLNAATDLAEAASCVSDALNETIECLKRVPAEVLLNTALPIPNAWRPSLDFSLISQTTLQEALKGNYQPVDILIGSNKDEGSLCLTVLSVLHSKLYETIVNNTLSKKEFEQLLNSFVLDVYKESNNMVSNLTSFMYSMGSSSSLRQKFVKFCGDIYIQSHAGKLADIISEKQQNIFVYELSHRPSFSNNPPFVEAGHGDDVLYAFGLPLKIENLPEEEEALTMRFLKMMEQFAYHGNPNAENETVWPRYDNETKEVMNFDTHPDSDDVARSTHEAGVEFWHNIIPSALSHECSAPMTSALIDSQENVHVDFFGAWISIPAAEYILNGLLCASLILLVSLLLALIVIIRYTSSMSFQRLK